MLKKLIISSIFVLAVQGCSDEKFEPQFGTLAEDTASTNSTNFGVQTEGACLGANDLEFLELGSPVYAWIEPLYEESGQCGFACFAQSTPECAACIEENAGLSEECSYCFAEKTFCKQKNCFAECPLGESTFECTACMRLTNCISDWERCGGFGSN